MERKLVVFCCYLCETLYLLLLSQLFDAKYIRKLIFLQLTDLFAIRVWKDMQDEEIPDELKRYVFHLLSLVLGSKANNTNKNYMYNFKQFSNWCQKYGYKSVPASNHHVAIHSSYLMDSRPSAASVNMAIYSISWAHKIAGLEDPCKSYLGKQIKQVNLGR